ncbi:MAG TPA: hypothetical protein VHC69_08735 [Polyangiaceae bacterium]|nr:hypothetical protein [Polyangiaceae bacterium]
MATRKAPAPSDDKNASDFIRAQPVSTTAPEVVEAGKKAGFEFSTSLVYAVRGRMKKVGGGGGAGRRDGAAPRRGSPAAGGARLESQIQGLVDGFVKEMSALVRRAALDAVRDALGERVR